MLQCLPWRLQKHTGLQKQTQKTLKTRKVNPTFSENENAAEKHAENMLKKKKKKDVTVTLQPIEQNQKFQRASFL